MKKYKCVHGITYEVTEENVRVRDDKSKGSSFVRNSANMYSPLCNLCLLEICRRFNLIIEEFPEVQEKSPDSQ